MTKVIVDGKILVQPTCLVLHQPTDSVLAIGEKAEQLLGFHPEHDLAAGLRLTVAWLAQQGLAPERVLEH